VLKGTRVRVCGARRARSRTRVPLSTWCLPPAWAHRLSIAPQMVSLIGWRATRMLLKPCRHPSRSGRAAGLRERPSRCRRGGYNRSAAEAIELVLQRVIGRAVQVEGNPRRLLHFGLHVQSDASRRLQEQLDLQAARRGAGGSAPVGSAIGRWSRGAGRGICSKPLHAPAGRTVPSRLGRRSPPRDALRRVTMCGEAPQLSKILLRSTSIGVKR